MQFYIYSQDLVRLGVVDAFKTLIWRRKYYTPSTFEMYLSATDDHLNLLKEKNIIVIRRNGTNDSGYIHSVNIEKTTSGEELIKVSGYSLLGYLYRRIIWNPIVFKGRTEELAHEIVDKNAINPVDVNRIIPNLVPGTIQNYQESISYQNSYGNVCEQLEQIGLSSGLGFDILFDERKKVLTFNVLKGVNRTVSQRMVPPVIFSREFDNILDENYYYSTRDYKNTALIGGEGEGDARILTSLNNEVGYNRYELFVDARDLRKEVDGNVMSDDEYQEALLQRGNEKLSDNDIITTFEAQIIPTGNYIYRQDYDLGDIVTVMDRKWGVRVDTRITEVEEVYEDGRLEITPTFGNRIPTVSQMIKKMR